LDNDTKKYRLIKARDLQLYEAAALVTNSKSQTDEKILLNIKQFAI